MMVCNTAHVMASPGHGSCGVARSWTRRLDCRPMSKMAAKYCAHAMMSDSGKTVSGVALIVMVLVMVMMVMADDSDAHLTVVMMAMVVPMMGVRDSCMRINWLLWMW